MIDQARTPKSKTWWLSNQSPFLTGPGLDLHSLYSRLTAHALNSDRDSALAAGCDDFDAKPVEFTRLLTKIDNLLTKASGA